MNTINLAQANVLDYQSKDLTTSSDKSSSSSRSSAMITSGCASHEIFVRRVTVVLRFGFLFVGGDDLLLGVCTSELQRASVLEWPMS